MLVAVEFVDEGSQTGARILPDWHCAKARIAGLAKREITILVLRHAILLSTLAMPQADTEKKLFRFNVIDDGFLSCL